MKLYDVAKEEILFKGSISKEAQSMVIVYGALDISALDKLIEILVTLRNGWNEE